MAKKLSLGTNWKWTKHVHPTTGVAVYAYEITETIGGRERVFHYRVSPENVRTGEGGWRSDIYGTLGMIPEALTPTVFKSPSAAAAFIVGHHTAKVLAANKLGWW